MITFNTDDPLVQRARLTHMIEKGPEHFRPLLRLVRDQDLTLILAPQSKAPFEAENDRATVMVVGDDLHEAKGPNAFNKRSLRTFATGIRFAVVVASEPMVVAYGAAGVNALASRVLGLTPRVMLVETRPEREIEWINYIRRHSPNVQLLVATTKDGVGHA